MMPAGKYYVGDLCYVMHEAWDEFCDITIEVNRCLDGEFNLKDGRRFATFGTKWGDGEYRDQLGNRYGVDAGLIGCIRVDDIDLNDPSNFLDGGNIVEFTQPFSVSGGRAENNSSWDGVIRIGHLMIETDPSEEYDETDEEEMYDD